MDRKRSRDVSTTVPLDVHIQKHREELAEKRNELPQMKAKLDDLRARRDACTTRRTVRLRRDLDAELAKLEQRVAHVETGAHIKEFERSIVPYMEAYARQHGAPKRRTSQIVVPGEPRVRFEARENTQSQADVVDQYLVGVHGEAPKAKIERRADMCPKCPDVAMVLVPAKAILACPKCGASSTFLDATSQSISYDESVEMVTFSYKRGNHFQDWLSNVQGQEAYEVPQHIVDAVMQELYKQRVTDINQITTQKTREILKTMKQRRCYEHVAQIVSRITGRDPPRLTPEASEMCKLMFTAVQIPFQRHCPSDRKNFLSCTLPEIRTTSFDLLTIRLRAVY